MWLHQLRSEELSINLKLCLMWARSIECISNPTFVHITRLSPHNAIDDPGLPSLAKCKEIGSWGNFVSHSNVAEHPSEPLMR